MTQEIKKESVVLEVQDVIMPSGGDFVPQTNSSEESEDSDFDSED